MRKKKIRFVILSLTLFIMSTVLLGCKHNIHKPIVLPDDFEVSEKSTPDVNAEINLIIEQHDNYSNVKFDIKDISEYSGDASIEVNNNNPYFTIEDYSKGMKSFIELSDLDSLGRCGTAFASLSTDTLATEERGQIGSIKPSGWHTVKYAGIDGNYLYNRCHLLMYALTGLNAEPKNLITGTRYLNIEGNLPYEEATVKYIESTGNHVLYRVTPIFEGDNLVCSGELMEAYSIEDNGAFHFCVYCYNVQPGITIDYHTGNSSGPEYTGNAEATNDSDTEYILNTNSKKIHNINCENAAKISDKNKQTYKGNIQNLLNSGYTRCGLCNAA